MVAYVAPIAHTKSEHSGSTVAGGGFTISQEWPTYSAGMTINDSGNRSEGARAAQVSPVTLPPVPTLTLPPSLTLPKSEPQLHRKTEGDVADYDLYMHGRKRSKLHDSGSSPVLQVSNTAIFLACVRSRDLNVGLSPECIGCHMLGHVTHVSFGPLLCQISS